MSRREPTRADANCRELMRADLLALPCEILERCKNPHLEKDVKKRHKKMQNVKKKVKKMEKKEDKDFFPKSRPNAESRIMRPARLYAALKLAKKVL